MKYEYAAVSLVLGALIGIPLLEAVLRKTLHVGISHAAGIVQHLTLMVGMMGGAIAAKENRLLALSRLGELLPEPWRRLTGAFSGSWAVAVSMLLAAAGMDFVLAERPSGQILAYGIPVWIVQLAIPIGFGLIALRLAGHATKSWGGRAIVVALAGGWILLWNWSPIGALIALGLATLAGVPLS